jgi:hypothetical protein
MRMANPTASSGIRPRLIVLALVGLWAALGAGGLPGPLTVLIEAALLARPAPPRPGPADLPPRAALLLAFHHAQDRQDTAGMLAAAARLETVGEHELAHHLRDVARGREPAALWLRPSWR